MDREKKHREYIEERKKTVSLNYRDMFFTKGEKSFLSKWWVWLNGLCIEEISTFTSKQKRFVNLFKSKISKLNEPPKIFERWYVELNDNQKTFVRFYFVNKLKEKIHFYLKIHKSDSIYFYSKVVFTFGDETDIDKRFKGTQYEKVVKRKNKDKAIKKLKELKELRDMFLITKDEFDKESFKLKKIILGN